MLFRIIGLSISLDEMARELLRLGVHINFAPTVDVNNNVRNPVIGTRSFSENKYLVAQKAYMYMLGMQSAGVMACAKALPGTWRHQC